MRINPSVARIFKKTEALEMSRSFMRNHYFVPARKRAKDRKRWKLFNESPN
jgi:hypothetical protein